MDDLKPSNSFKIEPNNPSPFDKSEELVVPDDVQKESCEKVANWSDWQRQR